MTEISFPEVNENKLPQLKKELPQEIFGNLVIIGLLVGTAQI